MLNETVERSPEIRCYHHLTSGSWLKRLLNGRPVKQTDTLNGNHGDLGVDAICFHGRLVTGAINSVRPARPSISINITSGYYNTIQCQQQYSYLPVLIVNGRWVEISWGGGGVSHDCLIAVDDRSIWPLGDAETRKERNQLFR